jgi:hypothetical protein
LQQCDTKLTPIYMTMSYQEQGMSSSLATAQSLGLVS